MTTPGGDSSKKSRRKQLEHSPGVHVQEVAEMANGYVSLPEALRLLKRVFSVRSIMVEGGSRVIGSFLASATDFVDCLFLTIGACMVGGISPATAFEDAQRRVASGCVLPVLSDLQTCQVGDDLVVVGTPKPGTCLPRRPVEGEAAHSRGQERLGAQRNGRALVLFLDLDGCIVTDASLRAQLHERVVRYCRPCYALEARECEELRRKHGSAIRGLQVLAAARGEPMPSSEVARFYKDVFSAIDLSALATGGGVGGNASGMHHQVRLGQLLRALPCKKVLVTDAPRKLYADRVLATLGLEGLWDGVISPEEGGNACNNGSPCHSPTNDATVCWEDVDCRYPADCFERVFLSESDAYLQRVQEVAGIRGVLVSRERPAQHALLEVFGCVPESAPPTAKEYLVAKESIDCSALNGDVRVALVSELKRKRSNGNVLRVLDVGAGLVSMLRHVAELATVAGFSALDYVALERSGDLVDEASKMLHERKGLTSRPIEAEAIAAGVKARFRGFLEAQPSLEVAVTMLQGDAVHLSDDKVCRGWSCVAPDGGGQSDSGAECPCGLVVACGFADLLPPETLSAALHRLAPGALCWMPITFSGRTWFEPTLDDVCSGVEGLAGKRPSDSVVTAAYHQHLMHNEGQHIDVARLQAAFAKRGARSLARGESNWSISPVSDPVMWEAMMRFIGLGATPFLWPHWSAQDWVAARRASRPVIRASNEDFLFELSAQPSPLRHGSYRALSFVAPRSLRIETREREALRLRPGQVELASICSLISTGTELKFFRGDFDPNEGEKLDSTLAGMEESIGYPMDYGYSLCGRVVAVGDAVDASHLGRLFFAFNPHASSAVVDAASLMEVPEGIAPSDAIYLPAIETALSIVHDAHPRAGERVLVIGQGLIGLLVTWLLSQMLVEVEVTDLSPQRLAVALRFGATSAWLAGETRPAARFDAVVEVSGSSSALQTAVDQAQDGGRVVIASWYPSTLALRLGTRFHRSHVKLIASQVSQLPAEVSATWTKQRRFAAALRFLRKLAPSRHLTSLRVPLERAHEAYDALDKAQDVIAAEILYEPTAGGEKLPPKAGDADQAPIKRPRCF